MTTNHVTTSPHIGQPITIITGNQQEPLTISSPTGHMYERGRSITVLQSNTANFTLNPKAGCVHATENIISSVAKAIIAGACSALAIATSYLGVRSMQPELLKSGIQSFTRIFQMMSQINMEGR